jgi:site-specific DNA-methyltransferase (adenine-specific)
MTSVNEIILGNNVEVLKTLPDDCIDAIITDSPYGLGKEPDTIKCLQDWIDHGYHQIEGKGFMGNSWDAFVPQPVLWKQCYRVLKPGGHLLSFFGTRTYDWGTLAIRLAGFEIRDCIQWIYRSGFPKSLDVSKAIDKTLGADRKIISEGKSG